ncbi:hypothetical protein [Cryobacterium soli]|uniref:hypothetical protein n=1 Tax=Cryobacterium soli TaxID=2220095 RepID=UPI000E725283|nr:hypothetical protein [Cryobacterium soli]
MALDLLPGEVLLGTSKANAVIVPTDYGLSEFATGQLLGLIGMANREAIGGHLHITTARIAFQPHSLNRLKGILSIPIPAIVSATKYRSGLAVGIQVETARARLQFVNWSGDKALAAIAIAQRDYGPLERSTFSAVSSALEDMSIRPSAEVANLLVTLGIVLTDAVPTWLEALSLIEWRTAADVPIRPANPDTSDRA